MREAVTLLPQFLHPTDRQAKGRTFQLAGARSLANELDEFACRLEQAEQELAKAGWRLNSETWRVERVNAGRGYGWRRRLTIAVARGLRPGQAFSELRIDQQAS